MPINAERIERLARLGLTESQARAYLALLDLASAPAKDVAALARLPKAKVYGALDALVARGLAAVEPAHPKRYAALPIDDYLETLGRDWRRRAEEIDRDAETLRREFAVSAEAVALEPRAGFGVVRGRRNAHARVLDALAEAESRVVARATPGFLARLARSLDDVEEARARGVALELATPAASGTERARQALARVARVVDADAPGDGDVSVLVVDARLALLARATPDDASLLAGDDVLLWTRDAAFARAFAAMALAPMDARAVAAGDA